MATQSKKKSAATSPVTPTLDNPLADPSPAADPPTEANPTGAYDQTLLQAEELRRRPYTAAGTLQILRQHAKGRMTVWERIDVLQDKDSRPAVLYQNWGRNLDGASIVTAVVKIRGRDVALYGHDFTVRAGSMDATNGRKLANLIYLAGKRGIPLIGMNDSAGAFVPAGIGGLDGYAEAFTALRKISGVVPSIMCMFGFNAGGGAYLPRQGSFMIQPANTFFGLTGPVVVKSALGEDVTPDDLGGPKVHGASGVSDITVADEVAALRTAQRLLGYLPDSSKVAPPFESTSDPMDRRTTEIDTLLRKAFNSPTGFNTPLDVTILIQQVCDHGDYFEIQPDRARNAITAFGRLAGNVVGFVANNSAVASGQIDIDAAYKIARFVRFCSVYNVPVIFMEDTTGFLPGRDQESRGIVQAGRAMLDAIIDLRTPRILLIIRNAFGGAYAAFNSYAVGADIVLALPTTRVAVMGTAGKEYTYKKELQELRASAAQRLDELIAARVKAGSPPKVAAEAAQKEVADWLRAKEAEFNQRYEKELMNPREALSLGSISEIVMPTDLRAVLGRNLEFLLRRYEPGPWQSIQREFH
ncbi:MAG: acetyl-CoA carboxylase carboxyltransferase subunit [Deltaproteobacteria bacterium]|nr:acetyl-CoA carboxylase carboxyltransferase subunit [Deltaproteobacteria bacterium]MBI3386819.1 acetyl-CoA carboxylase carboxyltransferase subunit [Deltaproteobacteria bacterium]